MASQSNVSREIQDSIREAVDRRVKLSIKRLVNYEVKNNRFEPRVLALSSYRLFVFTAKVPSKLETNLHYLDIKSIESKKPGHLVITTSNKPYTFSSQESDADDVNHMIIHICTSLKSVFPAFSIKRCIAKIEVQPEDRLRLMDDMMKTIQMKETGPCGGFTQMYACMCDFHNLAYREEVAWDVDTIYLSQDSRELCLRDFDHLKERDLVPIVAALGNNPWFTTLNANNVKLNADVCNEILHVMKRNCVIEALLLSNTGINTEFIRKLSTISMSDTQLHTLDLSSNPIDDVGAEHLFGSLSSRGKMFTYLDLSKTRVTSRGLNKVAEAMNRSPQVFSSLNTLKLVNVGSGKVEDLHAVYSFLASPNMISHLDLSGTDLELDKLMTSLLRGSSQNLTTLKLAKTVFSNKKMKEVVVQKSFKQFFASVCALKHLDISGSKIPPEALKDMLLGIGSNRNLQGVHLDISCIDLTSQGAQYLQECISTTNNISSLNISNIGFQDQDLTGVLNSVGQNKCVRHLFIGRVFHNIKPKNLENIMKSLVHVIQEENSSLESLSLADSKLKDSMNMIINALGSNDSLTEIDISGNSMGDLGARMLSKALQINNKLQTIFWDKNNTTCQGFEDIAEALEKNYVLRKMPMPVYDASAALRSQAERTEQALQTIERLLQRNHSPQKYSSDQAYRLQQGFLISSTQQMVDRLVVQSQDTINALSLGSSSPACTNDIDKSKAVIKDAENSKSLLPRLQDIANQSQHSGNPVEGKLREIANQLKEVLQSQMESTVQDMMKNTKRHCRSLMADQPFVTELQSGCTEKSSFPKDFATNVLNGVDTDIFNKLSELNLAVAAHISDRVIDEVITRLTHSHRTLTDHLNQRKSKKIMAVKESSKLDDKRKSIAARKTRPQSVIDRDHVQLALDAHNQRTNVSLATKPESRSPLATSKSPKPRSRGDKTPLKPPKSPKSKSKSPTSSPARPDDISKSRSPFKRKNIPKSPTPVRPEDAPRSQSLVPTIMVTHEDAAGDSDSEHIYDNAQNELSRRQERRRATYPELRDGLDSGAAPEIHLPPSQDLPELDKLPELPKSESLNHVTKTRAKRPQRNARPTPRQSAMPSSLSSDNITVDDDMDSFFTNSTTSIASLTSGTPTGDKAKSKESPKSSSNKSTPESKKKGLFGLGNKEAKHTKDKDAKKVGGGLLGKIKSKTKQSPTPANKTPTRISEITEEPDEPTSVDETDQTGADKTSLTDSIEEKADKTPERSEAKTPERSEDSSPVTVSDTSVKEDTASVKSGKSLESNDSDHDLTESADTEEAKDIDKKPADSDKKPEKEVVDLESKDSDKVVDRKSIELPKKEKIVDEKADDEVKTESTEKSDAEKDKAVGVKKEEKEAETTEEVKEKDETEEKEKKEVKVDEEEKKDDAKEKNTEEKKGDAEVEMRQPEEEPVKTESPKPAMKKIPGLAGGIGLGIDLAAIKKQRESMMPAKQKPATQNNTAEPEEKQSPFGLKNLRRVGDSKSKPSPGTKPNEPLKSPGIKPSEPLKSPGIKPSDTPKPPGTKPSETPKPPGTKSSETPKPPGTKASETPKLLGTKPSDTPKPPGAKPSETPKPPGTKASETPKPDNPSPVVDKKALFGERVKRTPSGKASTGGEDVEKRASADSNDAVPKPAKAPRPLSGKPAPPTRPKPPISGKPMPAPRRSMNQVEVEQASALKFRHSYDDTKTERKSLSTQKEEKPAESGVVYDSATLKLSVKDKISKFRDSSGDNDNKDGEQSVNKRSSLLRESGKEKKGDSLPKDAAASDMDKSGSLPRETTPADISKGRSSSKDSLSDETQAGETLASLEIKASMTDSGIVSDDTDSTNLSFKEKASAFGDSLKKTGSQPKNTSPSGSAKDKGVEKRPRSMLGVLESHPNLKNHDAPSTVADTSSTGGDTAAAGDTKDADKSDTNKDGGDDVIMV